MDSANKQYRASGTTLPFKDWLEREKAKKKFIPNKKANEELDAFRNADGEAEGRLKIEKPKTWFGLDRNVLIVSASVIALAVGVSIYMKTQKT